MQTRGKFDCWNERNATTSALPQPCCYKNLNHVTRYSTVAVDDRKVLHTYVENFTVSSFAVHSREAMDVPIRQHETWKM